MMSKTITLLGSSSGRNAGDACLVSGIMDSIDSACGEQLLYQIPTIRPNYLRDNYKNRVQPVGMMPWHASIKMLGIPTYRSILNSDLTLIFDAILFDRSLYNPLFNFMSSLYLMLPPARRQGKKMACFNVGAGPVSTRAGKQMLRTVADQMDFITVRDQDSYDILKDLGVSEQRLLLTADAALSVPPVDRTRVSDIFRGIGLAAGQDILAVNINAYLDTWAEPGRTSMGKERFLSVYAAALNRVLAEIKVPLLFVCTQHHDVAITEELRSRIKSPCRTAVVNNRVLNHYEIKGVLSQVSLLVGMRLHALILASSELTPVVGIAYQPKCRYYFRTAGLEDRILSFRDYSETTLAQLILQGWAERKKIKAQLEARIPVLKRSSDKAAELVRALLAGEDLEPLLAESRAQSLCVNAAD